MAKQSYVSIKQLAQQLGLDKSNARKYILKLGFKPQKRRTADSANQLTLTVTNEEAKSIIRHRSDQGFFSSEKAIAPEVGYFYVIQLVPELDPGRVKLGFASDLNDRLAQHRTSAPTAKILSSWPCRRSWEITAMDALTAIGARFILNEVFEVNNPIDIVGRGNNFFSLLPAPEAKLPLAEHSPYIAKE